MATPAIEFNEVVKSFRMRNRSESLRDAIPRALKRVIGKSDGGVKRFTALDHVSFSVNPGEVLGLVGANGAGKSTSLRLAASIYPPNDGEVTVRGRVSALIELSAGFHPDLSGRENIYLVGALSGIGPREIASVFDEIAEFADIGEYLDSPVRTYSSGMAVRLGFAVAAHVPAEILLVDEVLAVGDMDFRHKCLRRMAERRQEGVAVLFVSHNLTTIEQFCDRVVFLDHGKVAAEGSPRDTLAVYRRHVADEARVQSVRENATPYLRRGTGDVVLDGVVIGDGGEVATGDPLRVSGTWKAKNPHKRPVFGIEVHSMAGVLCAKTTTECLDGLPEVFTGEGEFGVTIDRLDLLPGRYEVSVFVAEAESLTPLDWHNCLYPLTVTGKTPPGADGVLAVDPDWRFTGI